MTEHDSPEDDRPDAIEDGRIMGFNVSDTMTGKPRIFYSLSKSEIEMPGYVEHIERGYWGSPFTTTRVYATTVAPSEPAEPAEAPEDPNDPAPMTEGRILGHNIVDRATGQPRTFISLSKDMSEAPGYIQVVERGYEGSPYKAVRVYATMTPPTQG